MHHDKFEGERISANKDMLSSKDLSNTGNNLQPQDNKSPIDDPDYKIDFNSLLNDLHSIIGADNLGHIEKTTKSEPKPTQINIEKENVGMKGKNFNNLKENKPKEGLSSEMMNLSASYANNVYEYPNMLLNQPFIHKNNFYTSPYYTPYTLPYQTSNFDMSSYYFNNQLNVSSESSNYQKQSNKSGYKEPSKSKSSILNSKNSHPVNKSSKAEIAYLLNSKRPAIVILSYKDSSTTNSMINEMSQEEILLLYDKIKDDTELVMSDINGNYFFQYFLIKLDKSQRLSIWTALSLKSNFVKLLINDYANYCFQKLIEIGGNSDKEEQKLISSILSKRVDELYHELKGTHILQKCIKHITLKYNKSLILEISNKFLSIINDSKGVCVIKQLMTSIKDIKDLKTYFGSKVIKSLSEIILNRFGHYAILHMIEEWEYDDYKSINEFIMKNIVSLLKNEYSQTVLIKLIERNPKVRKSYLIY